MAAKLKLIKKFGLTPPSGRRAALAPAAPPAVVATVEFSVTKTGGPVATSIEVGSSGSDDQRFTDQQLKAGTVKATLLKGNTYTVVWQGAFVHPGSATLAVVATDSKGKVFLNKKVAVKNPPDGPTFTRVVI
ncbi:MAG: hypothetical protein ABJC13_21635 [Acidobacteriota bacterium]